MCSFTYQVCGFFYNIRFVGSFICISGLCVLLHIWFVGSFTISGLCVLLDIFFMGYFIYQVCGLFYISGLWVLYIMFVGSYTISGLCVLLHIRFVGSFKCYC